MSGVGNYPCYGEISPTEGSTASETSSNNGSTNAQQDNRSRTQSGPTAPVAATANEEDQFAGICASTSFANLNTSSTVSLNNSTPTTNGFNNMDMKMTYPNQYNNNNNLISNQQQFW